jgi:drug/metabolite transporter (DMT)-like permease
VLGIALMVLAAGCNAVASVLQRRADRTRPDSEQMSLALIRALVTKPDWLLGVLAMVVGFVLHGVAIALSRIALVQPLLIAELPATLLLAARVFRLRLRRADIAAVALASVGLAALEVCLLPHGGDPRRVSGVEWLLASAVTLGAVGGLVAAGWLAGQEHRAALLGVATGAMFGFNSALIAGVGAEVARTGNLFGAWQTYAVAVVGPTGFFLLQNALAAGNLVASQPGLTLTNPLVATAWGLVVFGEQGRGSAWIAGSVAGAVCIVAGTVLLARSPLLDPDADANTSGAG